VNELQLVLLGSPQIRWDGVPVAGLNSGKATGLLCYLAVTARPHLRSTLVGLLWGDMPEASARNNLSKALTFLRPVVGHHLHITRQEVAFDRERPYWLDVERFEAQVKGTFARTTATQVDVERLQRAVDLYRGDFMEGFHVRQAPAFEEWVLARRARLRELALDALHTLAVHYAGQGEAGHAASIDYTTRLLALEPWREEAHRQLMLLLARSSQRGAALAQYEVCRQMLAQELGVEPAKETVALYEQIRADKLTVPMPSRAPVSSRPPAFLEGKAERHRPTRPVFVARERELECLDGHLEAALAGQERVVFITGEAGTGKTALVGEFAHRAQARYAALVVATGNCNAYTGLGDPYLPFREILGLLTGDVESRWAAGAIDTEGARRLWNLIPHAVQFLVEASPDLIGAFISGPVLAARAAAAVPGSATWLDRLQALAAREEPGRGRAKLEQTDLFEQYAILLAALSRAHPLLLVVDDLQWADAGSVSLLFHLGRQLEGSRILIVGLYRPADVAMGRDGKRHPLEPVVNEFQRYFGRTEVCLEQDEDRQFVESFLDSEPNRLGDGFRQALYQQTKGHALFTVEMLRGMQERGDLVRDAVGLWIEGPSIDWVSLPARVEGAIGERINRLPMPLQEMLKVASIEGEDFTAEVVAQARGTGEREAVEQLSGELDRRHRLVRGQGSQQATPGEQRISRYRFRHILIQKYVYNGLDTVERAYLHQAVGDALERLYEGRTGAIAIQLARHYQEAGRKLKAIDYMQQAGERAVRSYAYQEALAIFDRALALLETMPETPERARRELALQMARGDVLMVTIGFGAPEVGQAYARARELCQQAQVEEAQLFPVLWGLWGGHFTRAEHQVARELGEQLLHLAQRRGDPDLLLQAHHALWTTYFSLGEYTLARSHCEQGLAAYGSQERDAEAPLYGGHDAGVCCLSFSGLVLWCLGYPDQALDRNRRAVALAHELSHPVSLVQALRWIAALHQLRRETSAIREHAEAAIALATEHGFPYWKGWAASLQGWVLAQTGEGEAGIARIRQGLATHLSTGGAFDRPYMLALLAEAYEGAGRVDEALVVVDEALASVRATDERYYEAELHRLKGASLLVQGEGAGLAQAETCFKHAIEIARQQRSRSLELRAVMSLSRLWQRRGKVQQAQELLAAIYGWFSEGFNTSDLREAKALLAELAR
jgi:adenylate cyclase